MIEIIPAIMPKSFSDLSEKMSLVSGFVPMVQIDVMDGVFVPSKSWPYVKNPDPDFEYIQKEQKEFPYWQELDFEVDLMVNNAEVLAGSWIGAGAKRLIFHIESLVNSKSAIEQIKKSLPVKDSFLYTEIGIAINPDTPNEKLEPVLSQVDFVQFMGIQKIGFQGQPFDDRVLEKIIRLRTELPNVTISVDGSVNMETAPSLMDAGVNRLVIGSAIFEREDVAVAIEEFFALTRSDLVSK